MLFNFISLLKFQETSKRSILKKRDRYKKYSEDPGIKCGNVKWRMRNEVNFQLEMCADSPTSS